MERGGRNDSEEVCELALNFVAGEYKVKSQDLQSIAISLPLNVRWAKQVLAFLLRKECNVPCLQAAAYLCYGDSSLGYAINQIERKMKGSIQIRDEINNVRTRFREKRA